MSLEHCSVAVAEVEEQNYGEIYEPELKVLVNKRYNEDFISNVDEEPVSIRGRITISF